MFGKQFENDCWLKSYMETIFTVDLVDVSDVHKEGLLDAVGFLSIWVNKYFKPVHFSLCQNGFFLLKTMLLLFFYF